MYEFIIRLMLMLSPMTSPELARGIEYAVVHDARPAGWSQELTAAVLVVTAFEESRYRMSAVGDDGRARCALQVWGPPSLARDPIACARAALYVMREGARLCPTAPLAPYAGGCAVGVARQISHSRMARARAMLNRLK